MEIILCGNVLHNVSNKVKKESKAMLKMHVDSFFDNLTKRQITKFMCPVFRITYRLFQHPNHGNHVHVSNQCHSIGF